ncbi:MAG: urate hydroxylase PuuD [Acidimicrobiia bacterium]
MIGLELFTEGGMQFMWRWFHVIAGICWIGLLYYFNFVQVPAFAQMEAAARNNAMDKLAWRALWWFRWAAVATFATGLLMWEHLWRNTDNFFDLNGGVAITLGALIGTTMMLNVWGIIWRGQKVVIANARNVQGGGEADPAAPAAGRAALMASRQNAIFSFSMVFFMVGTSHFVGGGSADSKPGLFLPIGIIIMAVLELNAIGLMPWKKEVGKGLNWMYESHKNALISASALAVVYWLLTEILLLS